MLVFAGWLIASSELRHPPPEVDAIAVEGRLPGPIPTGELDLDRLPARELRRLPGIGPRRALAIANARWERELCGAPEVWDEIPGIGEETVRTIRAALKAEAATQGGPAAGRRGGAE